MEMELYVKLTLLSMLMLTISANGDKAKDREECADQLAGLATCLPYVSNEAKTPTPDCCSGLKQVLTNNKKCLCVIVRDRNDPDLGLNINVSLALGLPNVCHQSANVSKCPELLHMDPNSPEAKVFYQFGDGGSGSATAPSPVSSTSPAPTAGGDTMSSNSKGSSSSSGGTSLARMWFGLETMLFISLVYCFF